MPTFDAEDGLIPSTFLNSDVRPWINTSAQANGGTKSFSSNGTVLDIESSSMYIVGDFDAGDFDCDYLVSSESSSDFGVITVDGVEQVKVSGAGSWTAMTSVTLSAGKHIIQFAYYKDQSTSLNDDTFYIDNIVVPAFTDIKGDLNIIAGVVPTGTGYVNDATHPWIADASSSSVFDGIQAGNGGTGSSTSTFQYTSDSGAPAGVFMALLTIESETGFDFASVEIDSTEVFSHSESRHTYPRVIVETVTSGSHVYDFIYTKDSSGDLGADTGVLEFFFEPDFETASVTSALTGTATATIDEDDITTGGKTIIITLTGDTFKAAGTGPIGSTADTQALIDGFDAASSPTNGWNNEVRDKAAPTEVVRTSSTVATWTVVAQAGYDISSQETITGTIPTDVLVTGAGAITATPAFTIDAVVSGRIMGSLAHDGGLAGMGGLAGRGGGLAG